MCKAELLQLGELLVLGEKRVEGVLKKLISFIQPKLQNDGCTIVIKIFISSLG